MISNEEIKFEDHIRLVHTSIKKLKIYKNSDLYEDLFQVGSLELFRVIKRFKPELGYQFSTFAIPNIEGAILRYLRDNELIRKSRTIKEVYFKYKYYSGKGYSDEEICKKLNIDLSDLKNILNAFSTISALDFENEEGVKLYEIISNGYNLEEEVCNKLYAEQKIKMLEDLCNEKEKNVLDMFRKNITTQNEIAKKLGISQSNVSRILVKIRKEYANKLI